MELGKTVVLRKNETNAEENEEYGITTGFS